MFRFPSFWTNKVCTALRGDSTGSLSLVLQHREQESEVKPEDLNILSHQCTRAGPAGITLLVVREEAKLDQSESSGCGASEDLSGCRLKRALLKSQESAVNF